MKNLFLISIMIIMSSTLNARQDSSDKPQETQKRIAFYLQDGVEILDFAGPMEVFAYAGYEVFTVSKTKEPILAQRILKVLPDYSIADAPQADILAFFGGNAGEAEKDPEVIEWVQSQKEVDYHFSVCTGAFILAKSGLLENKTATTFHSVVDDLENRYPQTTVLRNARFVDNGKVITTAGVSAGIDGALHLVAKLDGFNAARAATYYMEYDKWNPEEGVNLSGEDPYEGMTDVALFADYLGNYSRENGERLSLVIDENEKSLSVILNDQRRPLLYLGKDEFMTVNNKKITFNRNEKQEVTGFKYVDEEELFFQRVMD